MKQVIGALSALKGYCESKKMKLSKIKAHVDNIGFLELRGANGFAHAYTLALACDLSRSFAAMADAIQALITEIERVIDAAHDEARKINRMIGNLDTLPEVIEAYGFTAEDVQYIIDLNKRLMPEMVESDMAVAHNMAIRRELCMGLLFEGNESGFMELCNNYGFSGETVEWMRGVVSRMQPCAAARNNAHYYELLVAKRQRKGQVSMTQIDLAYEYILNDAIAGDMVKSVDLYHKEILMRDGSWLQLVDAIRMPHGFYVKTQDKLA